MKNSILGSKFKIKVLFWFLLLAANLTSYSLEVPRNYGRYIVDKAGILSQSEKLQINSLLQKFERNGKGAQMAVLIQPSLKGESLEQYSLKVAETWKQGHRGTDKGLLLFIAMKEKKTRLEVGDGLEGVIPDGRAGDILRGLTPYMRGGQFKNGISYVIGKSFKSATGKSLGNSVPPARVNSRSSGTNIPSGIIFFFIFVLVVVSILNGGGRRRRGFVIFSSGGFSSGGGGFSSGGGFSGGGGGFSGGGASGGW